MVAIRGLRAMDSDAAAGDRGQLVDGLALRARRRTPAPAHNLPTAALDNRSDALAVDHSRLENGSDALAVSHTAESPQTIIINLSVPVSRSSTSTGTRERRCLHPVVRAPGIAHALGPGPRDRPTGTSIITANDTAERPANAGGPDLNIQPLRATALQLRLLRATQTRPLASESTRT
jgi:hypothetical protein